MLFLRIIKKVVAANVQIMNADPRRMFTFGVGIILLYLCSLLMRGLQITIESDQVTLWYHSRSPLCSMQTVQLC